MKVKELLFYLGKNEGKTINEKELEKFINKKTKKNKKSKLENIEPEIIISELMNLGLIEKEKKKYKIKDPFLVECKASVSPSGIVFGMPRFLYYPNEFPKDIFIAPPKAKGALPGDIILVKLINKKKQRFEGEVVKILKRNRKLFRMEIVEIKNNFLIGKLLDSPSKLMAIIDLSNFTIDLKKELQPSKKIIVKLSGKSLYFQQSHFFEAFFIRFEEDTEYDRDFDRILLRYNLNPIYPDYEIPDYDPENPESILDWKERKDLRNLYTITIDGEDAKDFDDAISYEILSRKQAKLFVHIADVSFYVIKDSPLDQEAKERGTSYYLANRVIPMLPPELSENLCSLVEGKNRLCITVEISINPQNGKITKYDFYRSIIKVNKRYTYEIADQAIETNEDPILKALWDLVQKQKELRLKQGRIDLDILEPKFIFDEDGTVKEIRFRERLRSSSIIEECMLSANICVAEYLKKKNIPTLYRIHEPMDEEKLEILNSFFKIYNIKENLKDTKPITIQKALEKVKNKGEEESKIFNLLLLKSFMQARYFPESIGHWGLAFENYCHFTSPIRRYPDLVVHRCLINTIKKNKKLVYNYDEAFELSISCSEAERKAMDAERDMWKLKIIQFIEKSSIKVFHGFISGIRSDCVFLDLEEYPIEGIVPAKYLTNEQELITPDPFSVYIKKLSRLAYMGEVWKLEIDSINYEDLKIYFKPIF